MISELLGAGGLAGLMMGSLELGIICFILMTIFIFIEESKENAQCN